jgi:uncharacterized protein (UPF0332 family)
MRVIVNPDVLRQFERKTATAFGLLQTAVDAAAPLDVAKLQDIVNELTLDRFNLAKEFLSQAQAQDLSTISGQKTAISRSYYAMYHAGRTIIFHYERADIDAHENISKLLPSSLPNQSHWANRLIDFFPSLVFLLIKLFFLKEKFGWRKRRNQVDYSPYPEGDLHALAQQIFSEAQAFLELCTNFLRGRGVPYV